MTKQILIVEDDEMLNAGLCYNLETESFCAVPVYDVHSALLKINEQKWDAILLDVNLPDGDGFELGAQIRQKTDTPIIFLTACDLDAQILQGFELGADDYITKPFNVKIVMQRIKAILRRSEKTKEALYTCGNLSVDFESRTAF
ncbi:MAG: response regulator transcription factor, partial [Eubacterium sp.]